MKICCQDERQGRYLLWYAKNMNRDFVKKMSLPVTPSDPRTNRGRISRLQTPYADMFCSSANSQRWPPGKTGNNSSSSLGSYIVDTSNLHLREMTLQANTVSPGSYIVDTSNLRNMKLPAYTLSKQSEDIGDGNARKSLSEILSSTSGRPAVLAYSSTVDTRYRYLDRPLGRVRRGNPGLKGSPGLRLRSSRLTSELDSSNFHGARSERQQKNEIVYEDVQSRCLKVQIETAQL